MLGLAINIMLRFKFVLGFEVRLGLGLEIRLDCELDLVWVGQGLAI